MEDGVVIPDSHEKECSSLQQENLLNSAKQSCVDDGQPNDFTTSSVIETKALEEESSIQSEEIEEILSEDVKLQKQNEAIELKEQGNVKFKATDFEAARDLYTKGLETCPKSYSKTISVLFSNRAACYTKLVMNDLAIKDCTSALELDSYYTKARLRRAQLYEFTEKLDEALNDYNEILKYDRTCQTAGEAAIRLPGQINERNEKLKTEMFSKLKELGNTCLKPFGLSTDNFKVQQDPNSGGYSINFQK